MNNLGNALGDRYDRTGELADLEGSITAYQQVLQVVSPNSPKWPTYLRNLGYRLRDRYKRSGNLADLEAAITAYQQVLQAISPDSFEWPWYLNDLANTLGDQYVRTRKLTYLDAAITMWEKAWLTVHSHFAVLPVTYQLAQQRLETKLAARLITAHLERENWRFIRRSSVSYRVLEIAEGCKSRLLTHLVGRSPLALPAGVSQEIAAQEQQLLADLSALDMQELATYGHLSPAQGDANHLLRLQKRQATSHELEELWTDIAHISLEGATYVALRRGTDLTKQEFVSLAEMLGPTTALLSFLSPQNNFCFSCFGRVGAFPVWSKCR